MIVDATPTEVQAILAAMRQVDLFAPERDFWAAVKEPVAELDDATRFRRSIRLLTPACGSCNRSRPFDKGDRLEH